MTKPIVEFNGDPAKIPFEKLNPGDVFYNANDVAMMKIENHLKDGYHYNAIYLATGELGFISHSHMVTSPKAVKINITR